MPRKPKYLTGQPYVDDSEMYSELPFLDPNNPWAGLSESQERSNYIESRNQNMYDTNSRESPSYNWGRMKRGLDYATTPYDDDDPYLKDSKGNYYYSKERGSPSDPNYFWDPYNRKTSNKIKKNFVSDILYNQLGSRSGVYTQPDLPIYPIGSPHPSSLASDPTNRILDRTPYRTPHSPLPPALAALARVQDNRAPGRTIAPKSHPNMKMEGSNVVFTNKEYIMDVGATTNAQCVLGTGFYKVQCNAGLQLFPVLAQMGVAFTLYRFRKLIFHFVSTSSASLSVTNSQLGTGIMAYKINTAQPDFQNIYEMQNYSETVAFRPSTNAKLELDCSKTAANMYYTRYDANTFNGYQAPQPGQSGQTSPLLIDQFNFYIGCFNALSANTVGLLYAEYECELSQVQLVGSQVGNNILYFRGNFAYYPNFYPQYPWPYFGYDITVPNVSGKFLGSTHGPLNMTLIDNLDGETSPGSAPGTGRIVFPPWISTGVYCIQYSIAIELTVGSADAGKTVISLFNGIFANCTQLGGVLTYQGYSGSIDDNLFEYTNWGWNQAETEPYGVFNGCYATTQYNAQSVGGTFTTYIQVTGTNASVPVQLLCNGSFPGTVLWASTIKGSSLTVTQCPSDYANAFNSGYYVNG